MKNRLAALVFFFAASCGAAQLGDFGQEYPVWSETDPFAITFSTNTAALLTLETAARKAGDKGLSNSVALAASAASNHTDAAAGVLSNYVDSAVAGVTAQSIGAVGTNDAHYANALTNETTTLAQAAARGGFAGTETIHVDAVTFGDEARNCRISKEGFLWADDSYGWFSYDIDSGLTLARGQYAWTVTDDGSTLLVEDWVNDLQVNWSFLRTSGNYTVAATSDITAHNAAINAHPDKVASTNGTAYNLALTGSPTLNGVALGAGGSSAPTYISVATATNLAVSAGSYYIDLTDWAATGMTWAANVEWDIPPELTVTGRYEFAFVTVGSKLSARQTWPESCEWHDVGNLAGGSYVQWASATNASAEINLPLCNGMVLYRFRGRGTTATPVYASLFYAVFSVKTLLRSNVPIANGGKWYYALVPSTCAQPADSNYNTSLFFIDKYGEGQTANTIWTVFWRQASPLERNAYYAGWRP